LGRKSALIPVNFDKNERESKVFFAELVDDHALAAVVAFELDLFAVDHVGHD
jgi:hypothetical protein